MAPDHGFEPRLPESESGVLPLHQSGLALPKSEPNEVGPIWKGRRNLRICSFPGTYANQGSGMALVSSDVVIPAGFEPSIAALKVR